MYDHTNCILIKHNKITVNCFRNVSEQSFINCYLLISRYVQKYTCIEIVLKAFLIFFELILLLKIFALVLLWVKENGASLLR